MRLTTISLLVSATIAAPVVPPHDGSTGMGISAGNSNGWSTGGNPSGHHTIQPFTFRFGICNENIDTTQSYEYPPYDSAFAPFPLSAGNQCPSYFSGEYPYLFICTYSGTDEMITCTYSGDTSSADSIAGIVHTLDGVIGGVTKAVSGVL